jgi:hypothetical protein
MPKATIPLSQRSISREQNAFVPPRQETRLGLADGARWQRLRHNSNVFVEGYSLEEFCSTPLAWAARCGRTNMVEFLLRRGACPTLADDPPWATPRAWATRRRHDDIVQLLRECETSGTPPARGTDYYDAQARDLVEASGTGEDPTMRRVAALFGIERPLMWDRPATAERVAWLRR